MAEMVDVRCEECGAVFPMMVGASERKQEHAWYPGKKCPICGSEKFFPVVRTDRFEPKPLAKWKVDRRVGIAAGVVIFVFLIVGFAWYVHERPHRKAGLRAVFMCDVCGKRFVMGVAGKAPKKCPECKSWAVYRAVQCQGCYEVYAWKAENWATDPPTCPKCKSKSARLLIKLSDVQKKPKPVKEKEEGAPEGEGNRDEEGVHAD
jgi:hypothetical protein